MIKANRILNYLIPRVNSINIRYMPRQRDPYMILRYVYVNIDNIDESLLEYIEDRFGEISHDDYKLIEVNIRNLLPKE